MVGSGDIGLVRVGFRLGVEGGLWLVWRVGLLAGGLGAWFWLVGLGW